MDFSFSGLKTSVRNFIARDDGKTSTADIAASLQAAIVDVLTEKMRRAARQTGIRTLCLAGGVAANVPLQMAMRRMAEEEALHLVVPDPVLCTDNAAMIAAAGYYRLLHRPADNLGFDTLATEPLAAYP